MSVVLGVPFSFSIETRNYAGVLTDDDNGAPVLSIYEDDSVTPMAYAGVVVQRGTGLYTGTIDPSVANGFSDGHWYGVDASTTVGSVTDTVRKVTFDVVESDAVVVDGVSLRTELGMVAADLDSQLDTILAGGGGVDEAGIRAAIGLNSANLDSQLAALPTLAQIESAMSDAEVGPGATSYTVSTVDAITSLPVPGVGVWITTDAAGANVVAGTLYSDANGNAVFLLDPGTYYVWQQRSGYNPTSSIVTVS